MCSTLQLYILFISEFQFEKCKQEHQQLLKQKENKQKEMQELEQQLSKVQDDLMASSHLLSPASLCSLSTHVTKAQQRHHLHHSTPLSVVRLNTKLQMNVVLTPEMAPEISPTVLASGQKIKGKTVKVVEKRKNSAQNGHCNIKQTNELDSSPQGTAVQSQSNKETERLNQEQGMQSKCDKACVTEQEVPKIDTPIVIASKPSSDDVFVKPFAPVKARRNASSSTCNTVHPATPMTTVSKTHKRQLFTSGQMQQKTTTETATNTEKHATTNRNQVIDQSDAMSGVYCHASPSSLIHSEFDMELLKQASGDQYWTKKRITNYVTSCPSSSRLTKPPMSVKRVSDLKTFKKNSVARTKRGTSSVNSIVPSEVLTIQESDHEEENFPVIIEVPIPNCNISPQGKYDILL